MKNLTQVLANSAQKYKDRPAFAYRVGEKFEEVSFGELYEQVQDLAMGLLELGVKNGDHVGLFADNRYEWILADMAVIFCGAADVPRGSDVTDHDIIHIVPHSDMKIMFVENLKLYEKIKKNQRKLPKLKKIILMAKGEKAPKGVFHLYDLMEKGKKSREKNQKKLDAACKKIKGSDLFTLIYTSGTTGVPKGVMLTHSNILSQIEHIPIKINEYDRMLSILPVWHIFERMFEMVALISGCGTYYTSLRNLRDDMKLVKPTFMASAPRLWEKVYLGIYNNIEKSSPVKKAMFHAAYYVSENYNRAVRFLKGKELDTTGRSPIISSARALYEVLICVALFPAFKFFDAIVLKKIRAATGGMLKGSVSGGGALPMHVDLFFNNIGIPVLEGYGLTETCPVLSVRHLDDLVIGTIGPLYPLTEARIMDLNDGHIIYPGQYGVKGELHVKGPQVMSGYYKNKIATAEVLSKDGWFNTRDIAMMTYNQSLKLYGRTKDTIVLLSGENAEPVPIEIMINQSVYVDNCMVVGQDQKYLGVLIVPSLEMLQEHGSTLKEVCNNDQVKFLIKEDLKRLISAENGFKPFERIVDFALIDKTFDVGDELTAKLSIKRHVITAKYQKIIDKMYKDR
ncbi:MAG: long-chain fatty acid--CoA ligase [Spirochaetia bacterium]|nr:long-chain fatty acid--CoA ligase [Spirochaetia bacterium]